MKLSDITVEDLRKGHDAFIEKMKQVRLENPIEMEHRGVPLIKTQHDPNWREKLRNKSPFDDEKEEELMTNKSPLPFTKFGDQGETMLANGKTTTKYDIRIDCVGCIDEVNSFIVLGYSVLKDGYWDLDDNYKKIRDNIGFQLKKIQNLLFVAGSDISYSVDRETEFRITQSHVEWLEKCIEELHNMLPPLKDFIIPNNEFHICRSLTRKAERRCWEMRHIYGVNKNLLVFLNRLSDYFFTVGRTIHSDFVWDKGVVNGEL